MQSVKRYAITLLGCSLIVIGGVALYEFNQPSIGNISRPKTLNSVKGATLQMKTHELQGLSITLSDSYIKRKSDETLSGPIVGQYVFLDSSSAIAPQVSITIGKLDGASVDDIPFAKQRIIDASRYEIVSKESSRAEIASLSENECSLFITNASRYIAVVMQAGKLTSRQLCEELRPVVSTIVWR